MAKIKQKRYFSLPRASEELGVKYQTLAYWVREGRVRVKIYPRAKTQTYRISERELERIRRLVETRMPMPVVRRRQSVS